ncbi:E3 ubiquitin ligase PQT3-like [Hibiscus syriacus]|uniref:E3 ubiquitin ligase PQT3-like n=1 Tax=Hibiscus syriacus TaxID=106335 RepID=UPI001921B2B4|nr:E3 ubiquitin ligase PQT3-like [Hibiscus syriacus]
MAFVYYKFKSSKLLHAYPINDRFISVHDFKAEIIASNRYGNGKDFDLLISDAESDQQFTDESALIHANSSVSIRRVPGLPSFPIVIGERKPKTPNNPSPASKDLQENVGFGLDFDPVPETLIVNPRNTQCKEDKINLGFKFATEKGFIKGFVEKSQIPPQGYVCYRCNVTGHCIQHCPTNGNPSFDFKNVNTISKMSVSSSNSSGISSISSNGTPVDQKIAPELHCRLCENIMKNASLTKCCFASFCDKCIWERVVSDSDCLCRRKITVDDILPNKTLRDTIDRIVNAESTGAAAMKRKDPPAENETQQQKKVDVGEAEFTRKRQRVADSNPEWGRWQRMPLLTHNQWRRRGA